MIIDKMMIFLIFSILIKLHKMVHNRFLESTADIPKNSTSNYWPKIANLYEYGYVVVWFDSNLTIYARIFNSIGYNSESNIIIDTTGYNYRPSVAGSPNGNFIVLFANHLNIINFYYLKLHKFDRDGNLIKRIEIPSNFVSYYTSCTLLQNGNLVISYTGTYLMEFAILDSDLVPILSNSCVTCNFYNKLIAELAALSDGNFIVVLDENRNTQTSWDVYAKIFKSDGSSFGDVFMVNTITLGDQITPVVAPLKNGGFVIIWDGSYNGWNVYARLYDSTYSPLTEDFQVNTLDNYHNNFPCVTELRTGGFIISFENIINGSDRKLVFAREFDSAGNPLTKEEFIATTFLLGTQRYSNIKSIQSEKWVIAYVSDDDNIIKIDKETDIKMIKCGNFTMKVNKDKTNEIDFMLNVSSYSNDLSKIKIIIKALPHTGILKNGLDDSEILLYKPYRINIIRYIPENVTPVTFTYSSYEEIFGESENCIVTMNVCFESCQTCLEVGNKINNLCSSCASGYYPLSDIESQCYSSDAIINGYFLDGKIFIKCPLNCKNCINNNNCTMCEDNYYVLPSNNNCYSSCPDGYYNNNANMTCLSCINGCKTCANNYECFECMDNWYLHNSVDNLCYENCPDGYFENRMTSPNKCQSCPYKCKECSNSSVCESCHVNYFLNDKNDNLCYAICPIGYFGNKIYGKCEKCLTNCIDCFDESTCKECKENYFLYNNNCLSKCPEKLFEDLKSKRCLLCPRICNDEFFFNDSDCKCYKTCPSSYFGDKVTNLCEQCPSNCKECLNYEYCLECGIDSFLHYLGDRKCYSACPSGYFPDQSTFKCEPCPIYYIDGSSICVNQCPSKYYLEELTAKCKKCPLNCEECVNGIKCNLCSPNFYNHKTDECSNIKPVGFFGDIETRKWKPCSANCQVCDFFSKCLECKENSFYLPNDDKLCGSCPLGFFGDSITKSCQSCNENCDFCENESECLICSPEYFLFDKICVSSCENGYYKNILLSTCSKCRDVCAECEDDSDNCKSCKDNIYVLNNPTLSNVNSTKCVLTCPNYFIPDKNRVCKSCEDLGMLKYNGKCVEKCEEGLFKNMRTFECVKCENKGDYKYEDSCLSECPIDTASNQEKVCVSCLEICKNDGECYIDNDKVMCKCKENYTGEFCELENINSPDNAGTSEIILSKTIELFEELNQKVNEDPKKIHSELTNKITDIVLTKVGLVNTGNTTPDPVLLKVFSTAFSLNILTNETKTYSPQVAINHLKSNMSEFISTWVNKTEVNEPITIVKPEFSVQISPTYPNAIQQIHQMATNNNISIVEANDCEEILKQKYEIPQNMSLIVKKIDYSSLLNLTGVKDDSLVNSNSIVYEYYNPITKLKMNTDVCKNVKVIIRAYNKRISPRINVNTYKRLSISGLNMLDSNSSAYYSRCIPIIDPEKNLDTTLMYRVLNYFQNVTPVCATNCTFEGLDDYGFLNCSCLGIPNGENSANSAINITMPPYVPKFNMNVFLCFYKVIRFPYLLWNPAFYIGGFFLTFGWLFYFFFRNAPFEMIETNIKDIVDNDTRFFDTENMSIEQYFEYNRIRIRKDPNNFKRLRANIEYIKHRKKNNLQFQSEFELPQIEKSKIPLKVSSIDNNKLMIDNGLESNKKVRRKKGNNPQIFEKIKRNFRRSLKWKMKLKRKEDSIKFRDPSPIEDIKMYKNRPYKPGVYFRFPDHVPTKKDFECLSPYLAVVCDDRDFKTLLIRFFIEDHPFFNVIYKKSLMNPRWHDVFFLCFTYNLLFTVNALLYTDSIIDFRIALMIQEGIINAYTYDLRKTLLSLLITVVISTFVSLFSIIPEKTENEFNNCLKTKNKHAIRVGYNIFYEKMKLRYHLFLGVTTSVNILSWYYTVAFCGIYTTSSEGWLWGSFAGILLDWFGISIAIPFTRACLRILIRKYKRLKLLISLEYAIWIGKNVIA